MSSQTQARIRTNSNVVHTDALPRRLNEPSIHIDQGTPRIASSNSYAPPPPHSRPGINPSPVDASTSHSSSPSRSASPSASESDDADFQQHYSVQNSSSSSSSSSSSGSDSEGPPPLLRTLSSTMSPIRRTQSALNASSLHNFAPPFYNRPPTPLPPSPSLTSLLRPSFSSTPSRPATPSSEGSDPDTPGTSTHPRLSRLNSTVSNGTSTPNSTNPLSTAALSAPLDLLRASPKVPTYEYYGFTLYLVSTLIFVAYLLWAYLPSPFLHLIGIHYYPNRWWAIAVPAWLVMALVMVYVWLGLYNTEVLTLGIGDLRSVVDGKGFVAVLDAGGRISRGNQRNEGSGDTIRPGSVDRRKRPVDWRKAWSEGTDAVMDVPVGGVCEILYGDG